jgi:hypothetical protein
MPFTTSNRPTTSKQYLPTPDEIRAACAEIQAGWEDEHEHRVIKNPEARIIGTERMPLWEGVGQTRDKLRQAVPPGKQWCEKNKEDYAAMIGDGQ